MYSNWENEKNNLIEENKRLTEHVKELQEKIGRWKRLAKDKKQSPLFVRESHDQYGRHIIELNIRELPGDVPLNELLNHLKYEVLPKHYPYRYYSSYTSKKLNGWVVKLFKNHEVDMSYLPNTQNSNIDNIKQVRRDILIQLRDWIKWINHFSAEIGEPSSITTEALILSLDHCYKTIEKLNFLDTSVSEPTSKPDENSLN